MELLSEQVSQVISKFFHFWVVSIYLGTLSAFCAFLEEKNGDFLYISISNHKWAHPPTGTNGSSFSSLVLQARKF